MEKNNLMVHRWEDVVDSLHGQDRWNYISAIRGPDLLNPAYQSAKKVFTCLLRGQVESDRGVCDIRDFLVFCQHPHYKENYQRMEESLWHFVDLEHWFYHIRLGLKALAVYYEGIKGGACVAVPLIELDSSLGRRGRHKHSSYRVILRLCREFEKITPTPPRPL